MNGRQAKSLRRAAKTMLAMTGAETPLHKDHTDWGVVVHSTRWGTKQTVCYKEGTFGFHLKKMKRMFMAMTAPEKERARLYMSHMVKNRKSLS